MGLEIYCGFKFPDRFLTFLGMTQLCIPVSCCPACGTVFLSLPQDPFSAPNIMAMLVASFPQPPQAIVIQESTGGLGVICP